MLPSSSLPATVLATARLLVLSFGVALLSPQSLHAQANVANQITNGSFTSDLSGWSEEGVEDLTSNWSSRDAAESGASGSFRGEAKGGTTWPSSYGTHGTVGWQCLDVEPDRVYGLSMDAQGDNAGGIGARGALYAEDITGQSCPTLTYVGEWPPSGAPKVSFRAFDTDWVHSATEFRTAPGQTRIQAGLHVGEGEVNVNGGWTANVWFDNIVVGKVRPDLQMRASVNDTTLEPAQTVTLTLDLASLRPNGVGPSVRVYHDDYLSLVSHSCSGTVVDEAQSGQHYFLWSPALGGVDQVQPYTSDCTVTARAQRGLAGTYTLRAVADCAECNIESQRSNNTASIAMETLAAPDFAVQQIVLSPFPDAGEIVEMALTLSNHGTAMALGSVSIEIAPSTLLFQQQDEGACANFSSPSAGWVTGAVLIVGGETVNCTIRFAIPANQQAVPLTATATIDTADDYDAGNNSASDSTRIVHLRVNRVIDGFDRTPGDGICESTVGSADCSLRAAVMEANALGGRRVIEVPYSDFAYQITRTSGDDDVLKGDVDIRSAMIIRGEPSTSGALPLLQAGFAATAPDRVFSVDTGSSASTIIENLGIAGQNLSPPTSDDTAGNGGLVHHASGELILRNLRLRNGRSETGFGGAVFSADALTIDHVLMHDNAAKHAGALAMVRTGFAIFSVLDSEFHSNAAGALGSGGALYFNAQDALLSIQRSTLHGNSAAAGGAITIGNSLGANLLQSTISGNTASSSGGGIFLSSDSLAIGGSTIVHNSAAPGNDNSGLGGGIFQGGTATVTLYNSILAFNTAQRRGTAPFLTPYAANCYPAITSNGYNSLSAVSSDPECSVTATTGDHFDTVPSLAALADNGGPTPTHAFVSPANEVDLGDPECRGFAGGAVLTTDQRGALRPADGDANGSVRCDKGAYELSDAARISVSKTGAGTGSVYSLPNGISCGATCSATFAFDTEVELTASASPGSAFAGWEGACEGVGTARCTVAAQGDVQVTAVFEQTASTYNLDVAISAQNGGGGQVVSDPSGIACPAACSAAFPADSTVTLTATPDADSVMLGLFGSNCGGSTDPCTLTMVGNRSVSAVFDVDATTLEVTLAGAGVGRVLSTPIGIDCPGDCSESMAVTDTVTLDPQPAVGSVFAGWSGACTGTGTCTLDMDLGPHAVTATFEMATDHVFADGFE